MAKIDRDAFIINQIDESGKEYVHLYQAVRSKRQTGTGTAPFKPLDVRLHGGEEVKEIMLFLNKLPPKGCQICSLKDDNYCPCQAWLLRAKDKAVWKFNDATWFYKVPWSVEKIAKINKKISSLAGLSQVYTNSSARPTGITSLDRAGFSASQISANSGHVDHNTMERYKKWSTLQNSRVRHETAMITMPSGRDTLRGVGNLFGKIDQKVNTIHDRMKKMRGSNTDVSFS